MLDDPSQHYKLRQLGNLQFHQISFQRHYNPKEYQDKTITQISRIQYMASFDLSKFDEGVDLKQALGIE